MNIRNEIAEQVAKAVPPVVVTAGSLAPGVTLNEWVAIATLIYILIQAIVLIRKERRNTRAEEIRNERAAKRVDEAVDEEDE